MKKKTKDHYIVERGKIFCLEPSGSYNQNNLANLVLVISNEFHNQFSNHLVVILATDKNTEQVRPSFETICEISHKKIKILTSHLCTISKETFHKLEHYVGKVDEETLEKIDNQIKLILGLSN
ncbi:MAG: type II toxin-antitoxin system PemK/MazF family toxin [Candidatus Moeniiplasma glomeromycotorum]|nr:type II toxin-antitoxin system PemK/MazF family toxin [Candidatus Moeniiplasma glomeromycotorum]MCE8168371.1 type II toxin-antitoxin system PemK/MazF family toxin [Candidatus Moeniiplasma glomeromycotorum]MCE8169903.1 type II toxin-antitoxin system PemK/MazF family toxin [Candidatus Moeniiplasma glomeromycotorum]